MQSGAGVGSGFNDEAYQRVGAKILGNAAAVFGEADLILKVKEPLESEWPLLRKGQTLFTYLHLAASRELTEALAKTGAYCFAYETLEVGRELPLLTPMSEVAGRMAIQVGAKYLEKAHGGSGILLGGVPGVKPAKVVVIGGGVVGINSARMAAGLGADVTVLDTNLPRLRYLDEVLPKNCHTVYSTPLAIRDLLPHADLVIGAVLIPGAAAPKLVRREDLKRMNPGSVIVDVAVDQGGCVETCKPTTHANPVFTVDGVLHYCVANMPGAVARTSTFALNNATIGHALALADQGWKAAMRADPHLKNGLNVCAGEVTHPAVAAALGLPCRPADSLL